MKKLILFTSLFLFGQSSMAHGPLLGAMKEMGTHFKSLSLSLKKEQFSLEDLATTESMQFAIATSGLHYPKSADSDALKVKYSNWMAELNMQGLELEEAIEEAMQNDPQEITSVGKILQEMNRTRKKGHDEFKIEHED